MQIIITKNSNNGINVSVPPEAKASKIAAMLIGTTVSYAASKGFVKQDLKDAFNNAVDDIYPPETEHIDKISKEKNNG